MSTNTALDDIKARVEGHTEGPWEIRADHGEPPAVWHDSEAAFPIGRCADCGVEAVYTPADAELIAAAPKLLAALEAVEGAVEAEVQRQRKESDRLWRRVLTRHPDRNFKTADRQEASAAGTEQVARHVRIAIQEALS